MSTAPAPAATDTAPPDHLDTYAPVLVALDDLALASRAALAVARNPHAPRPAPTTLDGFRATLAAAELASELVPGPEGPHVAPSTWFASLPADARAAVRRALVDQADEALRTLRETLDAAEALGLVERGAAPTEAGDSVDAGPVA